MTNRQLSSLVASMLLGMYCMLHDLDVVLIGFALAWLLAEDFAAAVVSSRTSRRKRRDRVGEEGR